MTRSARTATGAADPPVDPDGVASVDDGTGGTGGTGRRLAWSLLGLALLYAVVIGAGDARAFSGSDAGGKAATVATMVEDGTWDPDVGYWAADADPDGDLHPLVKTERYGDRWVQVTSLPMIFAAVPLWHLGGARAALVLPVLGGLAAAWGARRLARTLGAGTGWGAFWLVGAGSPVVFYVADLWEHAPALGLAVVALAVLVDPTPSSTATVVAAGAAAGAAAAIRAEMGLYLVVLVVAGLALGSVRATWFARRTAMVGAGAAAAVVVVANTVVERAVLSAGVQSSRVGRQLDLAGAGPADRVRDAAVTGVGLLPSTAPSALLVGALFVAGLALLGSALGRRGDDARVRIGGVLTVLGLVLRPLDGLGFVPGTLAAAPMAPAGITSVGADPRRRLVVATAVGALPLIWLLQWRGDLLPQWGGRYTLLTGVLLTVVAAVAAERGGWRRPAARLLVAAVAVVTVLGLAWHVERTRTVAAAFDAFEAEADDVVFLTTYPHLPREGGAWYPTQRWLRVGEGGVDEAAAVARAMGTDRVALVEPAVPGAEVGGPVTGFEVLDQRSVDWLSGTELVVTTYGAVGS